MAIKVIGYNTGKLYKICSSKPEAIQWINQKYPSFVIKSRKLNWQNQFIKRESRYLDILPEPLQLKEIH